MHNEKLFDKYKFLKRISMWLKFRLVYLILHYTMREVFFRNLHLNKEKCQIKYFMIKLPFYNQNTEYAL